MVSKPGGLNKLRRTPRNCEIASALKLLCGSLWDADSFHSREEGRCPMGSNGRTHYGNRRGTGAVIQEGLLRDNVGKGHSPAGADGDLSGLSV